MQGKSRVVQTRCGPIEYAEAGNGPALLVVHGAGGGFDQGIAFARNFAERGFRVIAVSRFGYLRTPMPADASVVAQADAHLALMDALGITRAVLFGGSAGAPSAMQFALRHRDRCQALVLLVPMAYVPAMGGVQGPALSPTLEKLLMAIVSSDIVYWLATKLARGLVIKTALATPPDIVRSASLKEQTRVEGVLRGIQPISLRAAGILNDARISASLTRYDLEKIGVPTLVLSVRDDLYGTFAGAQYTARHIPGAKFVGYDTGGHLWVGHHDDVIAEIAAFVRPPRPATRSHGQAVAPI